MNVSYEWLREYVRTDLPPAEVADVLTRIGLNVDAMAERPGGDVCFDVEVTSNRPDCLGHVGVARELAAALETELVLPEIDLSEGDEAAEDLCAVEVAEPDLCPLYTARVIRGVRPGESPDWMKARLEAVGVRPVANIVDVTNYVMMEIGQPLHSFDYAPLAEHRIVVRRARKGEHFVAIDHSEHTLSTERLVIADGRRAVALAGVMGGVETEIGRGTRDVLMEAAVFDPLSVRTTARALAMGSESSYRFERRVDPHWTDWAARRACALVTRVAGGTVARGVVVDGKPLPEPREVEMRLARLPVMLGIDVPAEAAAAILARLECEILETTGERLRVRVPSHRPDLEREVDLVEEVARHWGYDKVPESDHIRITYAAPSRAERVRRLLDEVLTAAGYCEAVTFSFTSAEKATRLAPKTDGEPLALRGAPLVLRQSVLPGLMDSMRVNRNAGHTEVRLFEVARRFLPQPGADLPHEDPMLGLVSTDGFEAVKGVVEALLRRLRIAGRAGFRPLGDRRADLDEAEAAQIVLDDMPIGVLGRATAEAAGVFDLAEPPVVAELVMERLREAADLSPTYEPLPQFPPITRDLALVVDEETRWEAIVKAVRGAGIPEVESIEPLDVYRGSQVPAGKKSVACRLVLRRSSGTLTHDEADAMVSKLLSSLAATVGATLRS